MCVLYRTCDGSNFFGIKNFFCVRFIRQNQLKTLIKISQFCMYEEMEKEKNWWSFDLTYREENRKFFLEMFYFFFYENCEVYKRKFYPPFMNASAEITSRLTWKKFVIYFILCGFSLSVGCLLETLMKAHFLGSF